MIKFGLRQCESSFYRPAVRSYHWSPATHKSSGNVPASKTFAEKKAWYAGRQKENADRNEIAKNSGFKTDWLIKSAVIVERPQVLTPEPEPWYAEYQEWKLRWEKPIIDQYPPILSLDEDLDEQKRKAEDRERAAKALAKMIANETPEEREERLKQEEREERMKLIRASHQAEKTKRPRSRTTEADKTNDRKSVYRFLDRKLFLIVKDGKGSWSFPSEFNRNNEALRETAENYFAEDCAGIREDGKGPILETYFAGNGPMGFHATPLEAEVQKKKNAYGTKTFYFYAYYIDGEVTLTSKALKDYLWVTKDELSEYFEPELLKTAQEFLPNDGKHEMLKRHHYPGTPVDE